MKSCTGGKYARWQKTKAGRLHPSGDGECTFKVKIPQLPASMYWIGRTDPVPHGGHINRREDLEDHCVYFSTGD
jgi:hypothetical protein